MDWIKVKTVHILDEYTDLTPHEFNAWIKIMALAARLEHEPTREQILKHVHCATLRSLNEKLMKHSCTLHDVLMKVLCDVHDVVIRRETWKNNKKKYRELNENVSKDVSMDVSTQDKIRVREDKIRINNTMPSPPKKRGAEYAEDFETFWKAYPKRTGSKKQAYDNWKRILNRPDISVILAAITSQIEWRENAGPDDFRPQWKDPERWIKGKMWEAETTEEHAESGVDKWLKQSSQTQ